MSATLTLNGSASRWYPASISSLEEHFGLLFVTNSHFTTADLIPLKKNLSYTLQYIEFLDRASKDINLSSVLFTQNIKSFVVYGASVIEAIFFYVVKSSENGSTSSWASVKKVETAPYDINGTKYKNTIEIYESVTPPISLDMTFDRMCKKVESKKLLGTSFPLYGKISKVRKLRNKIHIQGIEHATDTDWWNFTRSEYDLMREVLHGVLTSGQLAGSRHVSKFVYLT